MLQQFAQARAGQRPVPINGFSLLELLVAVAVISVAGTVYLSFYASSADLAKTVRNRTVAAALAEEQLDAILRHPETFLWQMPAEPSTVLFPIALAADDPKVGNPVEQPAAMPPDANAFKQQQAGFEAFRWKAFGAFKTPNAPFCEITVAIYWNEAGRERILSLTSALPRAVVEAIQVPAAEEAKS